MHWKIFGYFVLAFLVGGEFNDDDDEEEDEGDISVPLDIERSRGEKRDRRSRSEGWRRRSVKTVGRLRGV